MEHSESDQRSRVVQSHESELYKALVGRRHDRIIEVTSQSDQQQEYQGGHYHRPEILLESSDFPQLPPGTVITLQSENFVSPSTPVDGLPRLARPTIVAAGTRRCPQDVKRDHNHSVSVDYVMHNGVEETNGGSLKSDAFKVSELNSEHCLIRKDNRKRSRCKEIYFNEPGSTYGFEPSYNTGLSALSNVACSSSRSLKIKQELDSNIDNGSTSGFVGNSFPNLRRSNSAEESIYRRSCSSSEFTDNRLESFQSASCEELQCEKGDSADQSDCIPLDLSMTKSAVSKARSANFVVKIESQAREPSRKVSLLHLADAVTYLIENDPQSSEIFDSSRSSPSSLSDSSSSNSTLNGKASTDDYRYFSNSQEYFTESQENSLDGFAIKYEVGENFDSEAIVLNSNSTTISDQFYTEPAIYCPVGEMYQDGILTEVSDITVNDRLMAEPPHCVTYTDYVKSEQMLDGDDYSMEDCGGNGSDSSKRRLRLAKSEYESMTEQDRRVRHRVLDNQRSKQYRERRRKMVSSLQHNINNLEGDNQELRDVAAKLQRRVNILRAAMERSGGFSGVMMPSTSCVAAQC